MRVSGKFPHQPNAGSADVPSVREIVECLTGNVEALCKHLLPNGRREGAEWRCGSVQGEPGQSLGIRLTGAKVGIWCDFADGSGGDLLDLVQACLGLDTAGAIRWANSWLGIGDVERPTPAPWARSDRKKIERSDDSAGRTKAARAILQASHLPLGTLVETYFRHRGITKMPPAVQFHPSLLHAPSGRTLPAMVAGVQTLDGRITAVHRTYLRPDGQGKADVTPCKMALGPFGSGAVRLGPAGPVLGLTEGVETGISAMQLFDLPVWCSLSASRLDRLWLPPEAREVHVFADNGIAGHEAAERAAKAYQAQGRRVVVRFPPEKFGDFNDLLCAEAAA